MRTLLLYLLLCPFLLPAQPGTPLNRHALTGSLSGAAGDKTRIVSLGAYHNIRLGESGRFRLYYGPRYSLFADQHTQIPDQGTGGKSLIITPRNKVNHSINLALGAELEWKKFLLGFNIDAVGITLNPRNTYTLTPPDQSQTVSAGTKRFNLLTGLKDYGALNSEFYAGMRVSRNWVARVGLSHFFIQYAPAPGSLAGQSGRVFYNLALAGISRRF